MQFPTFVLLPKKPALNTPLLQGREVIVAALAGALSHLDTTHSVNNARASVDGDKAHLDALVEAQDVSRNDPSRTYLMKNRYEVELVRQGESCSLNASRPTAFGVPEI
ncbi:nuclear transport factor 2 family protein [Pseudomonas sp. YJ42]|uniref:nuclear transport factor 2 family protein n=1 Tax=Pseudomonas sp. YJ42 TaxID=3392115 RepID=UPI0039A03672